MPTVLITGANGLVGSHVAKRFQQAGFKVFALVRPNANKQLLAAIADEITFLEGDVLDILSLEKAIEQVEYVVHAAAVVSFSPKDRYLMQKINAEGTANVVNVCLAQNTKKMCFVSSVAALGRTHKTNLSPNPETAPHNIISESQKWEDSPLNSNYAKSKYLAECEVWRGVAEGLNAVIVNPSIVLGEGDLDRSSTQLFNYVLKGNKFYTQGSLNYVDVLDVAEAIYQLVQSDISAERFILNAGKTSYKYFFEQVAQALGIPAPHIPVTKFMAELAWRVEALKSFFTGNAPLVTRETAKSAQTDFYYDAIKIEQRIQFRFRSLEDSINRIAKTIKKT